MNILSKFTWLVVLTFSALKLEAQIVVWSEDFDGNSGAGSNWGTTNNTIGIQGITPNIFYISSTEAGLAAGSCGAAGAGDNSLHVGSTTVGDVGAAYDASTVCLPGCLVCDFLPAFCSDVTTNVRSESASFSTVGHTGMTITFNYMEFGDAANDNAELWYNDGGGWTLWTNLAKTLCCGGVVCTGFQQGLWTSFSLALPAALENNANVQIGFRWQNNADGVGTDPSFAVDDIFITRPSPLPVEWLSADIRKKGNDAELSWSTATENGSDKFIIERSLDGSHYIEIEAIEAAGYSSSTIHYSFLDKQLSTGNYLYRIKQVDYDGTIDYSKNLVLKIEEELEFSVHPNPATDIITVDYSSSRNMETEIRIFSASGRLIQNHTFQSTKGVNQQKLDVSDLNSGVYFITQISKDGQHSTKFIIQ